MPCDIAGAGPAYVCIGGATTVGSVVTVVGIEGPIAGEVVEVVDVACTVDGWYVELTGIGEEMATFSVVVVVVGAVEAALKSPGLVASPIGDGCWDGRPILVEVAGTLTLVLSWLVCEGVGEAISIICGSMGADVSGGGGEVNSVVVVVGVGGAAED